VTTAAFAFEADEAGASFACSLDGAELASCTSPQLYNGLAHGAHTFAVRATDSAGNTDPTPATRAWTVDTTPPKTMITSGPRSPTAATTANFVFSAESGATFECRIDAGAFAPCRSPWSASLSWLALGTHTFDVRATDAAGNVETSPAAHPWVVTEGVLMAAGDIACAPGGDVTATACRHRYTSDLLVNEPKLTNVLALGDVQYEDGCYADFLGLGAYDATWGRAKAITSPVPGNHEYHDPTTCPPVAAGYYQYFGAAAGDPYEGYYSFDLGPWHLIALNSNIAAGPTSAQGLWLAADLAATTEPCILAYWHRPRFSSGSAHGNAPPTSATAALWNAVYDGGGDVVLVAHAHNYERFVPLDKEGKRDDVKGVRQFVVGTGGASHGAFGIAIPDTSEARDKTTFGVLKLTLHASSYDWEFMPEAGGTFTDSGFGSCD